VLERPRGGVDRRLVEVEPERALREQREEDGLPICANAAVTVSGLCCTFPCMTVASRTSSAFRRPKMSTSAFFS
jgi:hypothetical protein